MTINSGSAISSNGGGGGASTIGGVTGLQTALDNRLRFDAAQTLTPAQQTQGKANLGIVAATDLLLTAKQITGTASATNVPSLVLTPDATVFTEAATHVVLASKFDIANGRGGSLSLQRPDNAATGGNQRGIGSIDMQVSRTAATQVAGNYSLALGRNQTVSGSSIGISNNFAQSVDNAGIAINNFTGTGTAATVNGGIAINSATSTVTNGISLNNQSNVSGGIAIAVTISDPPFCQVSRGVGIGAGVTVTNYGLAIAPSALVSNGGLAISSDTLAQIQATDGGFSMGSGGSNSAKYGMSMGKSLNNSGYANAVFGDFVTTGNYFSGVYTGHQAAKTKINSLSAVIPLNGSAVLKFGNNSAQAGYLQEIQAGFDLFVGHVILQSVGAGGVTAFYRIEACKNNNGLVGTPVITTLGTTDNTVTSLWTLTVTHVSGILRITAALNNAAGTARMQLQALG